MQIQPRSHDDLPTQVGCQSRPQKFEDAAGTTDNLTAYDVFNEIPTEKSAEWDPNNTATLCAPSSPDSGDLAPAVAEVTGVCSIKRKMFADHLTSHRDTFLSL
jgi:hypothetical protein